MDPLLNMQSSSIDENLLTMEPQRESRKSLVELDLEMLNKEKELLEIVQQDVDRTMQELDFFTSKEIKSKLSQILYIWSKDNGDLSYRQGMNEILAILIYAFHCEVIEDGVVENYKE